MHAFLILLGLTTSVGEVVRVPHAAAAVIDGRITAGEWDAARVVVLEDGTRVLLQHDGADVYVALHGVAELLGSLCVGDTERVHVLHASMALARASYVRDAHEWRLETGFEYTMREADFSSVTQAKRAQFHARQRWLANTTPMGDPAVREYRISRDLLGSGARLAVAYMRPAADADTGGWPVLEGDGCSARRLVMGDTPEPLRFDPAAWLELELEGGPAPDASAAARAARMDPATSPGELLAAWSPPVWFEGFSSAALPAPDGRRVILGASAAGDLRVLDLQTRVEESLGPFHAGLETVSAAVFDARGRLALAGTSRDDEGWFVPYGPMTRTLTVPEDAVPHWSPDGERVAYFRRRSPDRGLIIQEADRERSIPVPGMITALAWSAEGGSILVLAADDAGAGTLYRVRLAGGTPERLVQGLDAPMHARHRTMAISPDGRRAYLALASVDAPDPAERHRPVAERDLDIHEVDLQTGARRALVSTPADEYSPALAGGQLYWSVSAVEMSVVLVPADGGRARTLVPDAMLPTWRPDGRAVGFTFGDWRQADWVLNWDAGIVELDARANVIRPAAPYITGYHEDFSPVWSPDGGWVAYHSHRSGGPVVHYHGHGSTDDIYLRREGSTEELRLTDFGLEVGPPSWAPDGRRLVFTGWLGGAARSGAWITTIDSVTGAALDHRLLELPPEVGGATNAAWSPVQDVVAISAPAGHGRRSLWLVRPDGSTIRHLADYELWTYGGIAWTPDGSALVFPAIHEGRMQLHVVPAEGGAPRRLTDDAANLLHPAFSPDGRWIAATRIEHRRELRRMPLP